MGFRTSSSQDASLKRSSPYSLESRKQTSGIRKARSGSPKAWKNENWQPCVPKASKVSNGHAKPLTRFAVLARLVAAGAQYTKDSPALERWTKTVKAPPRPASNSKLVKTIMARIYGDIDNVWLSGMANKRSSRVENVIDNAALWLQNADFQANRSPVTNSISSHSNSKRLQSKTVSFDDELSRRYATVASMYGWMMLSILAHSKSFRNACRDLDESLWKLLMRTIMENYVSIELFFKVRGLDWATPLHQLATLFFPDTVASYIERQKIRGLPAVCFEKPHSYVVPDTDGILHRPNYQGMLHVDIPSNTYDGGLFRQDPSLCGPCRGTCHVCGGSACSCEPSTCRGVTRPLVELIHCSAQKGISVRSLQLIQKGNVLGEYVGELKYAKTVEDPTYALKLEHPLSDDGMQTDNRILIDARVYGNWTRYINISASCSPSLKFVPAIVGKTCRMMVVATRDIDIFEELTISYGNAYWLDADTRMCECNERNCCYPDIETQEKTRMIFVEETDSMDVDEDDAKRDEAM